MPTKSVLCSFQTSLSYVSARKLLSFFYKNFMISFEMIGFAFLGVLTEIIIGITVAKQFQCCSSFPYKVILRIYSKEGNFFCMAHTKLGLQVPMLPQITWC